MHVDFTERRTHTFAVAGSQVVRLTAALIESATITHVISTHYFLDTKFNAVASDMLDWTEADTNLGSVSKSALDPALAEVAFSANVGDPA